MGEHSAKAVPVIRWQHFGATLQDQDRNRGPLSRLATTPLGSGGYQQGPGTASPVRSPSGRLSQSTNGDPMSTDDYTLVEDVCEQLAARADEEGLASLSPLQRGVLLPYWAKAIVDNGGFQYFYEGAENAAEVVDAFERLGFVEAASAFRESAKVFPAGQPICDLEARREWMEEHSAEITPVYEALDPVICRLEAELWSRLAGCIREHPAEFGPSQ